MRFEDEPYVRVYTRTTATLKLVGWQGRAVLWEAMRACDRAGLIDVGEDAVEALMAVTDLPEDVVRPGLAALLRRGVVEQRGRVIILPRFLEAQTAKHSDRARKAKERETARAVARCETLGIDVTRRDDESRERTNSHARSHGVTNGHSDLSSSEISHTQPAGAPASAYVPAREEPPSDPDAVALLAELKRHPCLAEVATPAVASQLAGNAHFAAKRLPDVVQAISDTAREAGMRAAGGYPLGAESLLSLLGRFCAKAAPPRVGYAQRSGGPPQKPAGPQLPDSFARAPRPATAKP